MGDIGAARSHGLGAGQVRDGVELASLKPSFDRIVRVAMTLFGAADGEVTILIPGSTPWRSKGGDSPNTAFTDRVVASADGVWVEDLREDLALAAAVEPEVLEHIRFGAGAPIRLADGETLGVLTLIDVTPKPFDPRLARRLKDLAELIAVDWARHQAVLAKAYAEAEARAAQATMAAVVEASPVATAMTDRDMRLIKVSPRWREERRVGDRPVEGHTIYELFPGSSERWKPFYDKVLSGETLSAPSVRIAIPDGRSTWMRVEARPWREPSGDVGGVLMMSVDITDVAEALEAARRSEQRLKLAMDIGELNLWEMDFERHELAGEGWDDSVLNRPGVTFDELNADIWRGVHPHDRPAAQALWRRHVEDGAPFRTTFRMIRHDGPHVWVQAASEAVRGPDGQVARVVGVLRDIDKEKRAEIALARARDEAEAANRAKSEFLANMSHEIRTPLNGVMGVASALSRTDLAPAQREMVGLIDSSARTLERLLSDVLDLARIEAGRLEIRPEPLDVAEALRGVGALYAPAAREKGLGFSVEIEASALGAFEGDGPRIRQVLTNLVSNAVKFTEAGGVALSVSAMRERDGAVFTFRVADTGIGMDEAAQERLFQRFQQADGSITRRYGGSGLGLAISRSLAEAMGGSLTVESAPGRGTLFTLTLPLGLAAAPPAALTAAGADDGSDDLASVRVLLAEDHPTNRRVVELIMGSCGAPLTSVANGADAVDAWASGEFDLVLMDMQMPVMDGLSAIRAIRRREGQANRPRTLIYSLTANALPEDETACLAAGADGHLTKPVSAQALLDAVRSALEPAAQRRSA